MSLLLLSFSQQKLPSSQTTRVDIVSKSVENSVSNCIRARKKSCEETSISLQFRAKQPSYFWSSGDNYLKFRIIAPRKRADVENVKKLSFLTFKFRIISNAHSTLGLMHGILWEIAVNKIIIFGSTGKE